MSTAVANKTVKHDIRTLLQSDKVKEQIALALPRHMTSDRMTRVALTTINRTPALQRCTPESLLSCLMQCSQVGLEPDGRNAHLIPYGDQCTLIIDWKGMIALARRNGVNVTAKLVCEGDTFVVAEDDGTGKSSVRHVVDYTKPRGEIYAVYSRAVIGDDVDYEIMTKAEVESVRMTYSRSKDGDTWKKSWGEMAKKTVIRRHSKRWPLESEVSEAFNDDSNIPAASAPPLFTVKPAAIPEAVDAGPDFEPQPAAPTHTPFVQSEDMPS